MSDLSDKTRSSQPVDPLIFPQPANKALPKTPGLLDRFVERIKNAFFEESQSQLSGRVQELNDLTAATVARLTRLKTGIGTKVDKEAAGHLEEMINGLLREERRIHKSLKAARNAVEQAKVFKKHQEWVDKATSLLKLEAKFDDKTAVVNAIVKHAFLDYDALIDLDLQIIKDYEGHVVSGLSIPFEDKLRLHELMEERLSTYLNALAGLKERPAKLELGKVAEWKASVDKDRAKLFDIALHSIDEVMSEIVPPRSESAEQEHSE